MLKGIDENGNLQNVYVSEDGALKVEVKGDTSNAKTETTLLCERLTVGTTATEKTINKTVTTIMVANYSETADVIINSSFKIGPNLAIELPMNTNITNLSITATEDTTEIQLVVKGEE